MAGTMSINMPGFLKGVNYLSPLRYALRNLAPYTLASITFTCNDSQKVDGVCPITTGEQALDLYKLNMAPGWQLLGLGMCTIIYRFLAYVLLKASRTHWGDFWKRLRGAEKGD